MSSSRALVLERQQLLFAGQDGNRIAAGKTDDGGRQLLIAAPEHVALAADHANDDLQPSIAREVEDSPLVGVACRQLPGEHEIGAEQRAR